MIKEWLSTYFYNDMANIPVYLLTFGVALLILGAAIFFHELGHLLYFRLILKNKSAKIRFVYNSLSNFGWEAGSKQDYLQLNEKQYVGVYLFGILLGTIPILFSAYIWFPFVMILIPYFVGCKHDIKEINKNVEFKEN